MFWLLFSFAGKRPFEENRANNAGYPNTKWQKGSYNSGSQWNNKEKAGGKWQGAKKWS